MTKIKTAASNIKANPLCAVVFVLPFVYGGFHEFVSCALSVLLAVMLIVECRKDHLNMPLGISFFAVLSIPLFYLISGFWAVDRGMAVIGFVKYLPLPLFALLTVSSGEEKRRRCLRAIPYSAACMTVISFGLSFIPSTKGHITVSGRLAGFFEYPNTFALFLLLGLIVLSTEGLKKDSETEKSGGKRALSVIWQIIMALILLFGIFQSGSRTVFILLVISAAAVAVFSKNKMVRKATLIAVPSAAGAAAVIALCTDSFSTIGRFLTSSLTQSTFVGRILYFADAVPQILTHPFGQGFDSYFYTQGSFQTGVYTVKFIHNDFLQLFFEIGWIPALLLIFAIVRSFLKKDGPADKICRRLMLAVIVMHGMLDFSLQYMEIFFILLLLLDYGKTKPVGNGSAKRAVYAVNSAAAAVSLYFCVVCFFEFLGIYVFSTAMYPSYTEGYVYLMIAEQDLGAAKEYADKAAELNQSIYQTYLIKSAYAFRQGDVFSAVQNKEKAIALSPYTLSSYTEYIDMLNIAYAMYTQAGDEQSAEYCRKKITSVPAMLQKAKDRTSSLGLMIDMTPQLNLPQEYEELVKSRSRGNNL